MIFAMNSLSPTRPCKELIIHTLSKLKYLSLSPQIMACHCMKLVLDSQCIYFVNIDVTNAVSVTVACHYTTSTTNTTIA